MRWAVVHINALSSREWVPETLQLATIYAASTALFVLSKDQSDIGDTGFQQLRDHLHTIAPLCQSLSLEQTAERNVVTLFSSLANLAETGVLGMHADCPSITLVDTLLPHYRSISQSQDLGDTSASYEGGDLRPLDPRAAVTEILFQLERFQQVVSSRLAVAQPEDVNALVDEAGIETSNSEEKHSSEVCAQSS